jgi:periplasmic protein TonB
MANPVLSPPEVQEEQRRPVPVVVRRPTYVPTLAPQKDASLWASLTQNFRDFFSAPKPRPLEPGMVFSDPMAVRWSRSAIASAIVINGILLAILFILTLHHALAPKVTPIDTTISAYVPTSIEAPGGGGGGGGANEAAPVSKGKLPDIVKEAPPPTPSPLPTPPVIVAPVQLPPSTMPNLGALSGSTTVVSAGSGSNGGIGSGNGGGVGNGNGNGIGPGSGGGYGGGVYAPGNGVSAPVATYSPDAEMSEQAIQARFQGTPTVGLIVGADGKPYDVHIVMAVGMGLDEKAVAAVKTWRFKPGMKDGKPVATRVNVEVEFRIY